MQHLNSYSNLQIKRSKVQNVARGLCRKVGRATVDSCGKKSSELCFLDKLIVLINILLIIVVLYLFQSTYRPFLIPYYNIMQCIVSSFVITIVVFIFISKYFEYIIVLRSYYCWVYFCLVVKLGKSFLKTESRLQIALFLFYRNFQSPAVYPEPLAYLILANFPTSFPPPCLLGPPGLFGTQEYTNNLTIIETKVKP